MTWTNTWDDILGGGSQRWKVTDLEAKKTAMAHIKSCTADKEQLDIFCPLAGDDEFVQYAWSCGHSVTTIDLVPSAVAAMRKQFPADDNSSAWKESELSNGSTLWEHSSGRASLYQGDALTKHPELVCKFDVVYDKDSFGALPIDMREPFVARLSDYLKPNGIVYTEVKNKPEASRSAGPPFHIEKEDLVMSFGTSFEYVKGLGEVYQLSLPGMSQMGHILKRLAKK